MANNDTVSVTDSTGATALIAADTRDEVWLRNAGANTVYLALNETAAASDGFYLESGDSLILTGRAARSAIHMVCASSETATVNYQLVG